jgi:predicted Zn-dependent protease
MSEAEIAASGAPSWQQTIMRAIAKYGAYVVDTSGRRERQMDLVKEGDQSFTSFGYAGEMSSFVSGLGGTFQLVGVPIAVSKLRVINP